MTLTLTHSYIEVYNLLLSIPIHVFLSVRFGNKNSRPPLPTPPSLPSQPKPRQLGALAATAAFRAARAAGLTVAQAAQSAAQEASQAAADRALAANEDVEAPEGKAELLDEIQFAPL